MFQMVLTNLTDEEFKERSKELAAANRRLEQLKQERVDLTLAHLERMRANKEAQAELWSTILSLASVVETEKEQRAYAEAELEGTREEQARQAVDEARARAEAQEEPSTEEGATSGAGEQDGYRARRRQRRTAVVEE